MNRWSALLLLLVGCGPGQTTTVERRPAPPPPEVAVEPPPVIEAQKALPTAMRVVAADAGFIGFLDLQVMHGWAGEDAMLWAFEEAFDDVADGNAAARACLTSVARKRPIVAFGARHRRSGRLDDPFFAIELGELEPESVINCIRDAAPDAKSDPIANLPTVRDGSWSSAPALVATPRLLIGGAADQLEQAVEQATAEPATGGLRNELPRDPDVVLAFAARDTRPFASFSGVVRRDGDLLVGEMKMGVSDEEHAHDIERGLRKERMKIMGKLTPLFGGGHPFVTALQGARIDRAGLTILGSGEFNGYRGMKADILAKIAENEMRTRHHEALNTIGAIARGAAASFERENELPNGKVGPGRLCKSATVVPKDIPKGVTYQPSMKDGHDFETGDHRQGWRCLKFAMTQPFRYRYAYRQGGNYLGPKRGGPDPGPNGFEASAEGDLDGDGKTSFFSVIGTVDPKTGKLTRSTQAFMVDELE